MHSHDQGLPGKQRDGREVAGRIVGQPRKGRGVGRQRRDIPQQQRVAIGSRTRRGGRPRHAAGARPVLDDDRLAELRAQAARDRAAHHIGHAAGRKGHDERDRAGRIGG
jgi:hypothetical protein